MAVEECEYNPTLKEFALFPSRDDDCKNEAVWSLGKGKYHLCDACAKLPEFDKYTNRKALKTSV